MAVLNDLLNYDKIEAGELPLELTIVPIFNLIQKSTYEFILPFQTKKINFKLDFSPLIADAETDVENKKVIRDAYHLPDHVLEQRVIGDTMRLTQVVRTFVVTLR